jgi:hypothetical protein
MHACCAPAPARDGVNVPRSVTFSFFFERLSSLRPASVSLSETVALPLTLAVFVPVPMTLSLASSSSAAEPASGNANGRPTAGRRASERRVNGFRFERLALTAARTASTVSAVVGAAGDGVGDAGPAGGGVPGPGPKSGHGSTCMPRKDMTSVVPMVVQVVT